MALPQAGFQAAPGPDLRLLGQARTLVALGLAWHGLSAVVTLAAGVAASSAALIGFGADVAVETAGGLVVLWRLGGSRAISAKAERAAQRAIALAYAAIAAYVLFESAEALLAAEAPEGSLTGLVLAGLALVVMPQLCLAKVRIGERLGSYVVRREGMQNLMCAYLAAALLLGLGLNAAAGWWWAEPVAGGFVAAIAAIAAWRTWNSAACCASPPGTGLVLARTDCGCSGEQRCCG